MANFQIVKLSEVCQIESGGTPNSVNPSFWGDDVNWATLVDVKSKYISSTKRKITKAGLKNSSAKILPIGTVLFSSRATIGEVSIASIELATNQGFKNFICNQNRILPEYLYYVLKREAKNIADSAPSTTFKEISKSKIAEYKIPLPSIENQKTIIKNLDQVDILVNKRRQSIKLLDEYIRSVFLDMFGDPISNPKKWPKKELRLFGDIITGNTPPRNNYENYSSNFIEWIKTDNIVIDKTYLTSATEYLSETGLKKARFVKPGAILVACIAGSIESIGRAAIANRQVSFNQQINAIQPNEEVSPLFLYWLVKLSKRYIQSHAMNGMKKILTKGDFERIVMIIPPIQIQNKFAVSVEKYEDIKKIMSEQSNELYLQFQSLMQKSFSSKE